jgi:peptidyl-prolyl cis-trans isomerase A (cyclophilin A)
MVQSGDPKGDGTGGESIWKKGFAVEPTPFLYNIRGALAMANTGAKNSNGSQFYIVQNKDDQSKQLGNAGYPKPIIDAYKKGGYPAGDTKYTVFGQVIKGMDVVDTIANLEVDDNSKPKENVTVNSVEVVKDYKFK